MKNTHTIVLLLVSLGFNAQDQLFKTDNSKLLVRITEVNPNDVKFRLHSDPAGPEFVENRKNILLIIYENGTHEVISPPKPVYERMPDQAPVSLLTKYKMTASDSLKYYRYRQTISINFLSYLNNEVSLIWQYEFYRKNFQILVPLGFGLAEPKVTQTTYFSNAVLIDKKKFEVGAGINYYPALQFNPNYYIGPVFKFMQFDSQANYYVPGIGAPGIFVTRNAVISRYTFSITNGIIVRTSSRLNLNIFVSLGFKKDVLDSEFHNPYTGQKIEILERPVSVYLWGGINAGFSF